MASPSYRFHRQLFRSEVAMRRSWIGLLVLVLLASALSASTARADGLPVLGIDVGNEGVTTAAGAWRFVTLPAGPDTLVARVAKNGGGVVRSRLLKGTFTIPAVAYDASAGGLSADTRTLVLIEPRVSFPRTETTLVALDTKRLSPVRLVKLRGDYSFDAISPQGRWMYLIQYTSPTDPTRYRVRAYDIREGRMLARPVLDPTEPGDKMRGAPLSRTTSADGRWAYTLYDGAGGTPFVHALDTSRRTARCIDLDALAGRNDLWQLRLRMDGATVDVQGRHGALLSVDSQTFQVGSPRGSDLPLRTVALLTLALLLAGFVLVLFRRRDATTPRLRSTLSGDGG
jgi:hypothetical protein